MVPGGQPLRPIGLLPGRPQSVPPDGGTRGIPERPEEQIELLRQIEAISGDWIGNILDLTGVSETVEDGKVRQLSEDEMRRVFGTLRPSPEEARVGLAKLTGSISRGTAICFPVYEMGKPVSWLIAGYTAD